MMTSNVELEISPEQMLTELSQIDINALTLPGFLLLVR